MSPETLSTPETAVSDDNGSAEAKTDKKYVYLFTELEEAEEYVKIVRKQILDFFRHYAKVVWSFDALIREYIVGG